MKALIFAAHGSRKESSNIMVKDFAEKIKSGIGSDFGSFICSFLEFGTPGIEEALEMAVEKGMKEILIFPYFLFTGTHVTKDLPEIRDKFADKYPDIKIEISEPLGELKGFDLFIAKSLDERLV